MGHRDLRSPRAVVGGNAGTASEAASSSQIALLGGFHAEHGTAAPVVFPCVVRELDGDLIASGEHQPALFRPVGSNSTWRDPP
jgi:hypothetical protein